MPTMCSPLFCSNPNEVIEIPDMNCYPDPLCLWLKNVLRCLPTALMSFLSPKYLENRSIDCINSGSGNLCNSEDGKQFVPQSQGAGRARVAAPPFRTTSKFKLHHFHLTKMVKKMTLPNYKFHMIRLR